MLTKNRFMAVACCAAVVMTGACGGSPTGPSEAGGATVAGTVYVDAGSPKGIHAMSGAPAAGITVKVAGTQLSATVGASGYFQIDGVPAGTVRLQFQDATVDASTDLANVREEELVEIQVQVQGTTATVVSDVRSESKVSLCHRTENSDYHLITVSVSAEPAHRAHGDAKPGEQVPGSTTQEFDQNCKVTGPAVSVRKTTNGEDANTAPGPTILVGSPVTWHYIVTNIGTIDLTGVTVTDNRSVTVTCPATTLVPAQSMTCTGTGTAIEGQYSNIGTVTASSSSGSVTASDASHYFGRRPEPQEEPEGPKVQLCHRTGNGSYHLIQVAVSAEPAHRAHGDANIGEPVPGQTGKVFGAGCVVQ